MREKKWNFWTQKKPVNLSLWEKIYPTF